MKKLLVILVIALVAGILLYLMPPMNQFLRTQVLSTPEATISQELNQQYGVSIDSFLIEQLYYDALDLWKVEGGWVDKGTLESLILAQNAAITDFTDLEAFLVETFVTTGGTVNSQVYQDLQFFLLELYNVEISSLELEQAEIFFDENWFIAVEGGQFDIDRLIGYITQQDDSVVDYAAIQEIVTSAYSTTTDPTTDTTTDTTTDGDLQGSAPESLDFNTGVTCGEYPDEGMIHIMDGVPLCMTYPEEFVLGPASGMYIPFADGDQNTGILCGGSTGTIEILDGAPVCMGGNGTIIEEGISPCDECEWHHSLGVTVGTTMAGTLIVSGPGGIFIPNGAILDTTTDTTTDTTPDSTTTGTTPQEEEYYCPIEDVKDFDFGAAHYGVPTHASHDGVHLVNGSESYEWLTWLGDGVDAGEIGCCDDDQAIDQDGLLRGQSNRYSLFVQTNHLLTPVQGIPVTSELGILIVVRYERKGLPHQMEYEFITAEFIDESTIHEIAIPDPSTFENEGWLRLIYVNAHPELGDTDYDIRFGFDIEELKAWNGLHSTLMEIFYGFQLQDPFDPSIPPGEVEDYQYVVDCDGNVKFYTPDAFAWDYSTTGDQNCGEEIPPEVNYPTTSDLPVTVICNFNNVQDIVCPAPTTDTTGGTTGGSGGGTGGGGTQQPLIDQIEDMITNYQLDPNRNSAETRLRIIHEFLRATLPTL